LNSPESHVGVGVAHVVVGCVVMANLVAAIESLKHVTCIDWLVREENINR